MMPDHNSNGMGIVFSESTYRKISRILYELNTRLKANLTIFADMNGYPIDSSGNIGDMNINTLTAVAAGSFSASNEMSSMISGHEHFEHVLHEGARDNVYMCSVGSDYLMIIIFDKKAPIGFVRLLVHAAVNKLTQYLDSLRVQKRSASQFLDAEFRARLGDEMDSAFGLS